MTHSDDVPPAYRRTRSPGGPRKNRLTVTYNDDELAAVKAAARRDHLAARAWLGQAGLSAARDRQMPADDALRSLLGAVQDIAAEAVAQGRNLNQVVTRINAAGQVEPAVGHDLRNELRRVDETLLAVNEVIRRARDLLP